MRPSKGSFLDIFSIERIVQKAFDYKQYEQFKNWLLSYETKDGNAIIRYVFNTYGEQDLRVAKYRERS